MSNQTYECCYEDWLSKWICNKNEAKIIWSFLKIETILFYCCNIQRYSNVEQLNRCSSFHKQNSNKSMLLLVNKCCVDFRVFFYNNSKCEQLWKCCVTTINKKIERIFYHTKNEHILSYWFFVWALQCNYFEYLNVQNRSQSTQNIECLDYMSKDMLCYGVALVKNGFVVIWNYIHRQHTQTKKHHRAKLSIWKRLWFCYKIYIIVTQLAIIWNSIWQFTLESASFLRSCWQYAIARFLNFYLRNPYAILIETRKITKYMRCILNRLFTIQHLHVFVLN